METCSTFCGLFSSLDWWVYAGAVATAYVLGAVWYSWLFAKSWKELNGMDENTVITTGNAVLSMSMQLLSTALLGLTFFVLTRISVWLAVLAALAMTGWLKTSLKFRYAEWKTYVKAAIVDAGYFALMLIVFILFALI